MLTQKKSWRIWSLLMFMLAVQSLPVGAAVPKVLRWQPPTAQSN